MGDSVKLTEREALTEALTEAHETLKLVRPWLVNASASATARRDMRRLDAACRLAELTLFHRAALTKDRPDAR